ncbi:FecR domain-containing protein [Rhizobium sp. R86522]|uniref:FecR domain-containing protein n=1 Tax=Rhizobium sp. R86522 TaxID=3093861 RepID=UPI00366AF4A3
MKPNTRHALLAASAALFVVVAFPVSAETDVAGVTAAVNPDASTIDRAGKTRLISLGDPVIRNHRIETSGAGLVQILLADGTSFTVGPNSSVVIDSFVYDPEKNTAALAATMSKGALRFIGGKASKASGNVTIKTPIGTAGIRGAVVDINLSGQTPDGQPLPPHMTLVYGKEVQLTGNGAPQRLFKQGFSIVAGDGQPRVQRTPPQWVSGLQQVLAGRPGQSGGASNAPTEQTVASSPVAESNSAQLPSDNAIPVPTPRPIVTTPVEEVASASQRDVGTRPQVPGSDGNNSGGADTEIAVSGLSPKEVAGGGGSSGLRLTASRGTLTRNADGTLSGADGDSNRFTLPALSSTSVLTERSVSASVNGTPVTGTAYTGSGGFFTYMLTAGNDDPKAFYVIGGTPADARVTLSTGEILSYVLEPDLLAALTNGSGTTIPFTGSFDAGSDAAVVSNLLISGVSDTSDGVIGRALQASLVISGTGAGQQSAINVFSGSVESLSGGGYGLVASTAGSIRTDAIELAENSQGQAGSIGSTAGKDHFLGSNGEYLVIGSGSIGATEFGDPAPAFQGYEQVHVASRDDTATVSGSRTFSGNVDGFSSAVIRQWGSNNLTRGSFSLNFDNAAGTFTGGISTGGGSYFAEFYGEADRSYLSDQVIAGTNSKDGAYMVSSAVVPAKIFNNSTSSTICNACEFMTWGWWGRNVYGEVNYTVHLGNWIIGKQPENSALPTSGTATYNGNAVGTVINGSAQYIATGTMTSTMDFNARSGTVSVSNYDSKNFSAGVNFASNAPTFSGNITSGVASGSVTGAFAANGTDPVKGIMGNFSATDGSWESTGIFAGSTTGVVP